MKNNSQKRGLRKKPCSWNPCQSGFESTAKTCRKKPVKGRFFHIDLVLRICFFLILMPFLFSCATGPGVLRPHARSVPRITKEGVMEVPVLVYHHVARESRSKMMVNVDDFRAQMDYLDKNGYNPVTLDAFMGFISGNKTLPEKSVLLTFDDGWNSFYETVFPVLKSHGFPAVLFIYTDFIGSKNAMNWAQVKEMQRKGISVECHSVTHRDLSKRKKGESISEYVKAVENEVARSKAILEKNLGKRIEYFAYPYGKTNELVVRILEKNGYKGAFTVSRGGNPFYADKMHINRSVIYGDYTINEFARNLETFKEINYAGLPERFSETPDQSAPYFYKKGVQNTGKNNALAKQYFLTALLYDPSYDKALSGLRALNMDSPVPEYTVQEGETIESIAKKHYGDPDATVLVATYNNREKVVPGTIIHLPLLEKTKRTGKKIVPVGDDLEADVEKARGLLNSGKYQEAMDAAEAVLEKDYLNQGAKEIRNTALYQMAKQAEAKKDYQGALTCYSGMDEDFRDVAKRKQDIKKTMRNIADVHYKKGVKHYINENIRQAIVEWETTLKYNPDHENAKKEIEKAKNLLEKLEKM